MELRRRAVLATRCLYGALLLVLVLLAKQGVQEWYNRAVYLLPDYPTLLEREAKVAEAGKAVGIWLLLATGQVVICRAVERGRHWGRWAALLSYAALTWAGTSWPLGYVAGVAVHHLDGWALLPIGWNLLGLTALALMFWPGREVEGRA